MEAVLKNLEHTLELLAVAQTDFVKEWKGESVDRAFRWARYCEQVYTRFHANPFIRIALETQLRATNERLMDTLSGYRCLALSDLAQCQHKLFVALLKNPVTPNSVIKTLFDKLGIPKDAANAEEDSEVESDFTNLIRSRSVCKLMWQINLNKSGAFGLSHGAHVQGTVLLQRVYALKHCPGNDNYTKALLDSVLEDSGGLVNFSEVIAAGLLSGYGMNKDTSAQDVLSDWLQEHPDLLLSMCQSLSSELCAILSQQCPKFRLVYWGHLKKWASSLEYDVTNGVWEQQSDEALSFKMLVERLMSLRSSCSLLKEETKKELEVLKEADGNFEVQGLSVWTDLLYQLK